MASISFLCYSLTPSYSFAQDASEDEEVVEQIYPIKKDEIAPFAGTLFSTSAAARLLVDLETRDEASEIKCLERIEIQISDMQFEVDITKSSLAALQLKYDETLIIKNEQIDFLERHVKKPKIGKEVLFAVGVLSGVALTIGSAYVVNQAIND